jgi:hypothetical protein
MATNTYVALDTQTLTSNAASVTFTSINQGYTDLVLVCNSGQVTADTSTNFRVGTSNTIDTSSVYSDTGLNGSGSAASSYRNTSNNRMIIAGSNSSSIVDNFIFQIQNYSNTTTYKTVLSRANIPGFRVVATASLWRNTAAINTLEIYGGSNLLSGSTFTLYGIANSDIGEPKATGGVIINDGTYTYHTFGASGTFTPKQALTADVLVVAGGGGGGNQDDAGGGGGAGGLLGFASQSLTATGYTVTIGSGGAAATVGVDSQFGSLTLVKGGGSGGGGAGTGGNGGSGGGGSANGTAGGSATSGQGFAGASGSGSGSSAGGGGGGAGAIGGSPDISTFNAKGGPGGVGSSAYSSWASATGTGQNVSGTRYFAGGGGGGSYRSYNVASTAGAGGLGGGGFGSSDLGIKTGTANTGGGGGGWTRASGTYGGGAAGGSGIVIIRYLTA